MATIKKSTKKAAPKKAAKKAAPKKVAKKAAPKKAAKKLLPTKNAKIATIGIKKGKYAAICISEGNIELGRSNNRQEAIKIAKDHKVGDAKYHTTTVTVDN